MTHRKIVKFYVNIQLIYMHIGDNCTFNILEYGVNHQNFQTQINYSKSNKMCLLKNSEQLAIYNIPKTYKDTWERKWETSLSCVCKFVYLLFVFIFCRNLCSGEVLLSMQGYSL